MEKQQFAQLFEESKKTFVFKRKRAKKVGFATQEEIIANLRKRGIWKDEQYWQEQKLRINNFKSPSFTWVGEDENN